MYSSGVAALSQYNMKCPVCGNRDPDNVHTDVRRGDAICRGRDGKGCGEVMRAHIVIQGADRRNFEGEEDRKTFGPPPNRY
ncbi:hypothetical protein B484DRAFT_406956 [Ochromonadaceae sp. CCMP2298]|nr:hypothetical protein B484DRAFT_406956 [Ochromonadaceae sp. CCMP2298]